MRTADDQEPRLYRLTRELPHGASEEVLKPPDHVLPVDACTVVRLERNELAHCIDAGQRKDVKAASRGLAIGVEHRPASDHRLSEPVHVRPMFLQQLRVVTKLSRIGRISAVHEEVQLQRKPRPRSEGPVPRSCSTGDAFACGRNPFATEALPATERREAAPRPTTRPPATSCPRQPSAKVPSFRATPTYVSGEACRGS
jgi:hypothetical protein